MSTSDHTRTLRPSPASQFLTSTAAAFSLSRKRKTMSITQTYHLAHSARAKLSSEAARADHNLRLLVGHANLLDALMLELAEAEQEQESWFNHSVRGATKHDEQPAERHITWADAVVEDPEEDWQAEDADSDSDSEYDSDAEADLLPPPPPPAVSAAVAPPVPVSSQAPADEEEPEFLEDDAEDYTLLSLVRTHSHSQQPPELSHDSEDDSSEDESMPPSPPSTALPTFSEKQMAASFYDGSNAQPDPEPQKFSPAAQAAFFEQGFFLPQRSTARLVSAISVY